MSGPSSSATSKGKRRNKSSVLLSEDLLHVHTSPIDWWASFLTFRIHALAKIWEAIEDAYLEALKKKAEDVGGALYAMSIM